MLKHSRDDLVLQLTLARSEKRNALDADLTHALLQAIRVAGADRGVGAILLDAEGPTFSAGMDLDESLGADPHALGRVHAELFAIRGEMEKPLVVAVQGPAFGGALGLIANAHIVVAADTAEFGLTELRVGMWPFLVWRSVAAAIGERRTMELALTSRMFGAAEALAFGLVHDVVPADRVAVRARELAHAVANASGETIARGLRASADPDRRLELRAEQFASADFEEGVRAFREKRAPRWPSRVDSR